MKTPLDLSALKVPDAGAAAVYPARREHPQRCFDVQTRRCVCGIENMDVRIRDAATEMFVLLNEEATGGRNWQCDNVDGVRCAGAAGGPACWAHRVRALVARLKVGPQKP